MMLIYSGVFWPQQNEGTKQQRPRGTTVLHEVVFGISSLMHYVEQQFRLVCHQLQHMESFVEGTRKKSFFIQ